MDIMSSHYGKIYSERSLMSFEQDADRTAGRYSLGDNSDKLFGILKDIVEEVLDKPDHELEELAFMNLKIAQVIINSSILSRLQTVNELRAVLFQIIILIKEQCISCQKPDKVELLEMKMKYNTLRNSHRNLENVLTQAKKIMGEGGKLIHEITNENADVLARNRTKKARVENMIETFDVMRNRIGVFGDGHPERLGLSKDSSKSSREEKDSMIDKLEESLEMRGQQINSLKVQFESYKSKCEKTLRELENEKQEAKRQVIMLRSRVNDIAPKQQYRKPPMPPTSRPGELQKDLMAMIMMQSLSLEQLIA